MAPSPGSRCSVRPSALGPPAWIFDFDPAMPGGGGGAAVVVDTAQGLASISGVHKNTLLPRRSTGALLAEGLCQVGMARPAILEAYNVLEKTTLAVLNAGGNGQGTLLGNMLANTAAALGGTITRWQSVWDGHTFHLRVFVSYP